MNPVNFKVLDCTLNEDGSLATITIASPDELKSYVYTTTFLKTVDNSVNPIEAARVFERPTYGDNQRNPDNGF